MTPSTVPIDMETFEEAPEEDLSPPTNPERVLGFLLEHDDEAFTPSEVADRTEVRHSSISTVLRRLEHRDLVRHRGEYWAVGPTDRIRVAYPRVAAAVEADPEDFEAMEERIRADAREFLKHVPWSDRG